MKDDYTTNSRYRIHFLSSGVKGLRRWRTGLGSSKPDQANYPGLVKFFISIYDPASCMSLGEERPGVVRLDFHFPMQAFWVENRSHINK